MVGLITHDFAVDILWLALVVNALLSVDALKRAHAATGVIEGQSPPEPLVPAPQRSIDTRSSEIRLPSSPLTPRKDGSDSFKVMQFADLHFGDEPYATWSKDQDERTSRVMEAVLDAEQPDLVVFSGDQITGDELWDPSERFAQMDKLYKPLEARGIPWATIFGNHDAPNGPGYVSDKTLVHDGIVARSNASNGSAANHSNMTQANVRIVMNNGYTAGGEDRRHEYLKYDITHNLSHTAADGLYTSADGKLSNYRLKIFASTADARADKPSFILWFLDTGGGKLVEGISYDQVAWMRRESASLDARYGPISGALYLHVPLSQYAHAAPSTSLNNMGMSSKTCVGWTDDGVTALTVAEDKNIFSSLADMHIGWVFAGHDHGNDWCCRTSTSALPLNRMMGKSALTPIEHNVHLCYGRHSGYGGYSTPQLHLRGARVMQIDFVRKNATRVSTPVQASSSSEPLSLSSAPSNAPQGISLRISPVEASSWSEPMSSSSSVPTNISEPSAPEVSSWVRLETGFVEGEVNVEHTFGAVSS